MVSKTVQRARQRDQVKMFDDDLDDIKLRKSSPRKPKRQGSLKKSKSPKKPIGRRKSPSKGSNAKRVLEEFVW